MKDNNKVVGNYYYCDDKEIGSMIVDGKGERPYYILCGINNDYYFAIVCTTKRHTGSKKSFQNKKYIENDIGSLLRLDAEIGFHHFKKSDIREGKYRNKKGSLLKEHRDKLLNFYSYDINQAREKYRKMT